MITPRSGRSSSGPARSPAAGPPASGTWSAPARPSQPGGALPAIHVDGHDGGKGAALAAVTPTGLRAAVPQSLVSGWQDNQCQRTPGRRAGHQWQIWQVVAHGAIDARWRARQGAEWRSRSDLQEMAQHTAAYAGGKVSRDQFAEHPGIDPAWIHWLQYLGLIAITPAELELAAALARGALGGEGWFTPADQA